MRSEVRVGDSLVVLKEVENDSIASVVTDPPYELGFMGKGWDASGIAYSVPLWTEVLRVLKPGGHLLAFGGTRTYHRMTCAIQDAGFEIRDCLSWLYGSGFPKSLDVSKAIDKAAGAEREVVGTSRGVSVADNQGFGGIARGAQGIKQVAADIPVTAPATPAAKQWEGWGTALKPAWEPIVLARKPLEGTVAANVQEHGTGAINVDGCRVSTSETIRSTTNNNIRGNAYASETSDRERDTTYQPSENGRWPANLAFDETAAEMLDEQSGERPGGAYPAQRGKGVATGFGKGRPTDGGARQMGDSGGASRFFYVAKASRAERNAGLDGFSGKQVGAKGNGLARSCATCGASVLDGCECPDRTYENPKRANHHPTVKPVALMRWLVRMVTPPNGTVLDPFLGSGTTGIAAHLEGFDFVGIEREAEYAEIAKARIAHWQSQPQQQKLLA